MTRIAVMADIHGNLPALEAVISDLEPHAIDVVVVAGDVVNQGPSSRQVLEIVNELRWTVIRGNNEYYLLDYDTHRAPQLWRSEPYPILAWLREQIPEELRRVVGVWPDSLSLRFADELAIKVVHGSPRSPSENIHDRNTDVEIATMLDGVSEQIVIAAHTHWPMDRVVEGWRVLNPGSVGHPFSGRHEASYLILEGQDGGWDAQLRIVPFDVQRVLDEFDRLEFVAKCGAIGQLFVDEFKTARSLVPGFVRWRNSQFPGHAFTMELLDRYKEHQTNAASGL